MPSVPNDRMAGGGVSECANCGSVVTGEWCGACGQNRRASRRLNLRQIARDAAEHVLNLDGALIRTMIDLTVRPGTMCRDYVAGRRKRYLNPIAYYLFAGGVQILAGSILNRWFTEPDQAGDGALDIAIYLLLASLLPFAVLWRWLFRRSGYNLIETMVFAVFISAQFLWFELILMLLMEDILALDTVAWIAWVAAWFGYTVWAASDFFKENIWITLAKILVSLVGWLTICGSIFAALASSGLVDSFVAAG